MVPIPVVLSDTSSVLNQLLTCLLMSDMHLTVEWRMTWIFSLDVHCVHTQY